MKGFMPASLAAGAGGWWLVPPDPGLRILGIGTDSRQDLAGKAFFALRGERHDGHAFLDQATGAGAAVLVVDRAIPRTASATAVLLVEDTRAALSRLAAAHRKELSRTTVIAVTGSCGKTTVKALLHAVLSSRLRGSAAPKSFNNDVGLPLAILAADPGDDYLVLEIGANHCGEVAKLARIARPDVGLITMVGRAHLEGFGTPEAVVEEKAAMLDHLCGPRLAVVNADAPPLRAHLHRAQEAVLFGAAPDADVRLTARGADERGWWFEVGGGGRFAMGLPGRHNAINALGALAVARRMGLDDALIGEALRGCRPVEMRMSLRRVDGLSIYNDAYNANPDSVLAALATFAEEAAGAGRRIVVLGDMRELGPGAPEHHREVGRRLLEIDGRVPLHRLVLVGRLAAHVAETLDRAWVRERVTFLDDLDRDGAMALAGSLQAGDAVLLKGSRAMRLEAIEEAIAAQSGTAATLACNT